jgi:hypothetical protein
MEGKIFRESLQTDVSTTAKLRQPDFIKSKLKTLADPLPAFWAEPRPNTRRKTPHLRIFRDQPRG